MEGVPLPGAAFFLTVLPQAPEVIVLQKDN
jgi:hypothetical protein